MKAVLWIISGCAYLIAGFLFLGFLVGAANPSETLIACAAGTVGTIAFAALTIIDELKAALSSEPPPPSA